MPAEMEETRPRADDARSTEDPPVTDGGPLCPFCRGGRATLISLFGALHLLSQYRCRDCGSYFDGVRPGK